MLTTPAGHMGDGEKKNPALSLVTFIELRAFTDFLIERAKKTESA